MATYSVGDDGQTIRCDGALVALGASRELAAEVVRRLNSPAARQEDVDLLRWLLAEARDTIDWYHKMGQHQMRIHDELMEERDAARVDAAFWNSVSGGGR